jgi:transcriptional regulator with XRE-family HTH domain
MKPQKYPAKLIQVLAFANWTQDHLADLLNVSNNTLNGWVNGRTEPRSAHAELIDEIWGEIVEPYVCELETRADEIEKRLLKERIKHLPDDDVCKVE